MTIRIGMELLPRLRKLSEWRGIRTRLNADDKKSATSQAAGESWNENGWSFRPRDIGVTNAASRRRRQFTGIIHSSDVKALFGATRKSKITTAAIVAFVVIDLCMFGMLAYWLWR